MAAKVKVRTIPEDKENLGKIKVERKRFAGHVIRMVDPNNHKSMMM